MSKIVVKRVLDINDVEMPALGKVTLFIDDNDGRLKYKDEFGNIVIIGGTTTDKKVFRALLTQTLANNPAMIVLENSLGILPTIIRSGVGNYILGGVASVTTDPDKLYVNIGRVTDGEEQSFNPINNFDSVFGIVIDQGDLNNIQIITKNNNVESDGMLSRTPIEIIAYE